MLISLRNLLMYGLTMSPVGRSERSDLRHATPNEILCVGGRSARSDLQETVRVGGRSTRSDLHYSF